MKKRILALALVLAGCVGLAGCGSGKTHSGYQTGGHSGIDSSNYSGYESGSGGSSNDYMEYDSGSSSGTVYGSYGDQLARPRNYLYPFTVYSTAPKEESGKDLGYTYPLVFDTPLRKCTGFTLDYMIGEVSKGDLSGNFRYEVLVRTLDGTWKSAGTFKMDGTSTTLDVQLGMPMGIDAVTVTCGKTEHVTYSFDIFISNPQYNG